MPENKFDLQKKIEAEGVRAIDTLEERSLRAIQSRVGEYHTYFDELTKLFADSKRASEGQKLAVEALQASSSLVKQIDVVLNLHDVKKASEASKNVLDQLIRIESAFQFLSSQETLPVSLQKQIAEAEERTGLTVKEMKTSSTVMKSRYQKMGSQTFGEKFKDISPKGYKTATDIGKGALLGILGPFGQIAGMGMDIYKEQKARKKALGEQAFAGSVLTKEQKTPEGFAQMSKFLAGSEKAKISEDVIKGEEGKYTSAGQTASKSTSGGISGGGGGIFGRKNLMEGMIAFFSGPAFSTPWTKKLLEAVSGDFATGVKESAPKPEGSGFDKIMDAFRNLGPLLMKIGSILGPALAIAGAAFAGWQAGKFINEKLGVGKAIQGTIAKHTEKSELSKNAQLSQDPLTRRALELQAANPKLSPVEAIKMAQAEGVGTKTSSETLGVKASPTVDLGKITVSKKSELMTDKMSLKDPKFGDLDPATGLPLDKSKMQEFQKENQRIILGEPVSSTKNIPIDTSAADIEQKSQEGLDKLSTIMTDVKEEVKKSSQGKASVQNSGYDAYNTRDPIISAMNSGALDIATA